MSESDFTDSFLFRLFRFALALGLSFSSEDSEELDELLEDELEEVDDDFFFFFFLFPDFFSFL